MNIGRNAALLVVGSLLLTGGSLGYMYSQWEPDRGGPQQMMIAPELREFFRAAARGDADKLKQMLAENPKLARADAAGIGTALHRAAARDQVACVKILLDAGADLNAAGMWGGTPLHMAAWLGQRDAVDYLIRRGAKPEARCTSFAATPLLWAAYGSSYNHNPDGDYVAVCESLIAAGAKAETFNKDGLPATTFADDDVLQCLLDHGAQLPTTRPAAADENSDAQTMMGAGPAPGWGGGPR